MDENLPTEQTERRTETPERKQNKPPVPAEIIDDLEEEEPQRPETD